MTSRPRKPRRFATAARHLREDPDAPAELVERLSDDALTELSAAIREEVHRRALAHGDRDAIVAAAFETGFGRDGLAHPPWVEAGLVVCPGGLFGKNRANHRCRFVSVSGVWIWESSELLHESKRSLPGAEEGFRAVALLPLVEGLELDLVRGRLRRGQHSIDQVVSLEVRRGELVEVSQRAIKSNHSGF